MLDSFPLIQTTTKRKRYSVVGGFVLVLIILGGTFSLLPVMASSSAQKFSPAINLSNDAGVAKDATISNNGQNVYVAWTESSKGIFFRESSNGGSTWSPPTTGSALKLSPKGGVAQFPVMFTQYQQVNTGDVYVTWAQTVTQANGSKILQIFVAASTNNGKSFTTTQISQNATNSQNTPAIAAWGSDVYVAWNSAKDSAGSGSIYVSSSTNNGQTWSKPVDVINPCRNGEAEIVASGSNIYLVSDGIDFSASSNSGASWSAQVNLFQAPFSQTSIYYGREPWIAASGSLVSVVWEANSTAPGISYHDQGRTSTDGGLSWGPTQNITDPLKDNWEPENVAYGNDFFMTFHSLGTQGVYATSTLNVNSETPTWTMPVLLSPTKLTSSFGHIFTSDGVNIFVMWGQKISTGSSTWNAYVAYSGNSGATWSSPIDISNNAQGVAAGNQDVTLFALTSNGANCFAAWTYTNGGTSQIYFAGS
jgi:hypothetical protein